MSKDVAFTMKLEADLRDAFMAEAQAADRPASQVVREMMRDYIARQQAARDHDAFVRRKVEAARASVRAGVGVEDAEVEAEFAARRTGAMRKG